MSRAAPTEGGFSLIEVLVATLLLSTVALALTRTLTGAQRGRAISEQWLLATQLAAEGIEQLRAGGRLEDVPLDRAIERVGASVPWAGHPGLRRIEVTVSWDDGERYTFQLATLVRQ